MEAKVLSLQAVVFIFVLVHLTLCDVVVVDRKLNKTKDEMLDEPALFGPPVSFLGLEGLMNIASPIHGCSKLAPPPPFPAGTSVRYRRWFALVHRGNCTFVTKVLNAQAAGYSAVIVMNIGSDFIQPMSPDGNDGDNVTIPSVFLGQTDGDTLQYFFDDYTRYGLILVGDLPNIQSYLLPFAITVAACFLAMLICMIVKCVRDYRRSMRHRLSWRSLRKIPQHKFVEGDPYDVCAICLDDYVVGDKLRVLPCNHAYHSKCIDPWLTKRRRVCPVCKQKVHVEGERPPPETDDEEDTDVERGANGTSETAPLLQQATQVSAGTFANNVENPFQRASRRMEERRQRRANRTAYEPLDDTIQTASDDSSPASDAPPPQPFLHETTATSVSGSTNMLPEAGESRHDQLDVVTVTRSARRDKRKKKSSRRPRELSETETPKWSGQPQDSGLGEPPKPPSCNDASDGDDEEEGSSSPSVDRGHDRTVEC